MRVARRGDRPPLSPETRSFIRIVTLAAAGAGFGPYLSIYAISVLGESAGYAILLSAVSAAASLVAATIVGGLLNRGSASRTLRLSFVLRGGGILLGLLAFPGNPLAWLVLLGVAVVVSAGASAGVLASNERLLRLTGGVDLIGAQSRFVAGTAAGLTVGQLGSAGVLALLPVALPDVRHPDDGLGRGAADPGDPDRRLGDLVDGHRRLRRGRAAPAAPPGPPRGRPPPAAPAGPPDDRGGDPA